VGTTVLEDERFHQIADQFDKPTRRRTKRLVLRGSPPVDDTLVPLARAYAVYMARSVGDAGPNTLFFWTQIGLGVLWLAEGAYKVFGTGDYLGVVWLVMGLTSALVLAPLSRREVKRARDGLSRSRAVLGLEPLPAARRIGLGNQSRGTSSASPASSQQDRHRHVVRAALRRIW
jgi:hypothetical protein